jgi:hypothetical protein
MVACFSSCVVQRVLSRPDIDGPKQLSGRYHMPCVRSPQKRLTGELLRWTEDLILTGKLPTKQKKARLSSGAWHERDVVRRNWR